MTTDGIPWITGRRRAVARAFAVMLAESSGVPWDSIGLAQQSKWVSAVESRIEQMKRRGVLAEFVHPYAGEPIPDTEPAEDAAQEAPKARRARR